MGDCDKGVIFSCWSGSACASAGSANPNRDRIARTGIKIRDRLIGQPPGRWPPISPGVACASALTPRVLARLSPTRSGKGVKEAARKGPLHLWPSRLWQRSCVSEDEQPEVPVAGQDDPVAVLVLGQGDAPEVVAVGIDVVTDLGRVGRIGDVDDPEPARVPGEVRQVVVVRRGAAFVGSAPRHLDLATALNSALGMARLPRMSRPAFPRLLVSPMWPRPPATSL